MPATASGEIKIRIVHQPQKNGDIYVLERRTLYDPVKKYNKVLSSRIISKIPKGEDTPVPTRPKRSHAEKVSNSKPVSAAVTASRSKVGIYLLATNGQSLPGILTWQLTHPLPYEDGISEDVYHDLFEQVGRDESLQQSFFLSRCAGIRDKAVLAYDSTTINKAHDGLQTIKVLTLYSIETRQPVAFTKQPGNLPDVITIENALKQLDLLGLSNAEIVTDNGYYSEQNLADMLHAHFDFITLSKVSIKWVKKELKAHADEFRQTTSVCPYDTNIHGITVMLMHDFSYTRKYASRKKGIPEGEKETFTRRIYLHLFFNPTKRVEEDAALDHDLLELKNQLEEGTSVEELSASGQEKAAKYLQIRHYGSKTAVAFNEKAIRERKEENGYFALVSNCEKEPFECLRKYRRRETIESFFEAGKQHADGTRSRVWNTDTLRGRLFVQFVSLCYYEYLSEAIREMKKSLGVENGDPEHDQKENLKLESRLKSWLGNTPLYLILQWFDTVEEVRISSKLRAKRWTTEITKRDRLFLQKLGYFTTFGYQMKAKTLKKSNYAAFSRNHRVTVNNSGSVF